MLLAVLIFAVNLFVAYKMYLGRFRVRMKHASIHGVKAIHIASALHFASVIAAFILIISTYEAMHGQPWYVEANEVTHIIEKTVSVVMLICSGGPFVVWIIIELIGSFFFNKEFAGGGLK